MTTFWKKLGSALLSSALATIVIGSPAFAARIGSPKASAPEAASDVSVLRAPDPQKELRHLCKDLKLTRNQRITVGTILQERTREIRLLLEVEPMSQDYSNGLAAKIVQDSNAQIETFLKKKQKRKFDREFAVKTAGSNR